MAWPAMTYQQQAAIYRVIKRHGHPQSVSTDRGVIMVNLGFMWLGIEPDGYTHS